MKKTLYVELNQKFVPANSDRYVGDRGAMLLTTPPIDEDYWLMRVPLTDKQAVVCFPKFFTIGIGFQVESDWNTNLPYTCDAERIYEHIRHNKGDRRITKDLAIRAIILLQTTIEQHPELMPKR